jgi:hypothetical protein
MRHCAIYLTSAGKNGSYLDIGTLPRIASLSFARKKSKWHLIHCSGGGYGITASRHSNRYSLKFVAKAICHDSITFRDFIEFNRMEFSAGILTVIKPHRTTATQPHLESQARLKGAL